ncbi:MAG: translation initiation factor IF-2 [Oscillospiraceae bacterium]|nr:translation initiation factor IF-2 [Oscillospiraceae bacterium]
MIIKYRIYALAKDLGIQSKRIMEFMAEQNINMPKKHQTILEDEQLNMIFDYLTSESQADSLSDYLSKESPASPAVKAQPSFARPPQQQKPAFAERKPRPQGQNQQQKPAQAQTQNNNNTERKPQRPQQNQQQNRPAAFQPAQQQRPPAAQPPKPQQQAQKAATKTVYVDTKAAQVDLEKYNERYEEIAGGRHNQKDSERSKQKITQKSAQRARSQRSNKQKETEAQRLNRIALEKARKQQLKVSIPEEITVGELATRLKASAPSVIKKLMNLGVMASITEMIDFDTASMIAIEFGAKVEKEVVVTIEERLFNDSADKEEQLVERNPVVVVMGHVDHGKTSLLDAIRNANVVAGEAGGITQHIGAYRVEVNGKYITFLDTPGHEAFTEMRARGAQVTDIAILVVAADDGIMPQTIEAINHAKAAKVSIIVAINKMDKPGANPDRIKEQLTQYDLVVEEWGGDVIAVPISAKTGQGIGTLLEMVQLVADVRELRANPNRLAKGTVIEARLDKGRGPVATLLVQNGTLRTGDVIIAGMAVGHVRTMFDDKGRIITEAGPSVPAEITGLGEVPSAGDIFNVVEDERLARVLTEQRRYSEKEQQENQYRKITLENLFSQIEAGEVKELPLIVKADVKGSVEAVRQSLEKLTNPEVRVRVIHSAVGAVNESDVMLARSSSAIIIGFNVAADPVAKINAEIQGVDIRSYRVIYEAIDEVKDAMKGMLAPKYRDVTLGRIEVRMTYRISSVGTIAGCYVLEGEINRNCKIKVIRDGIIIAEDQVASLKRFKDDVKEVKAGFECGIGLEKFNDIKDGDIFEAFITEEYRAE